MDNYFKTFINKIKEDNLKDINHYIYLLCNKYTNIIFGYAIINKNKNDTMLTKFIGRDNIFLYISLANA